ncbi:carboxypeptidase M32 [Pseudoroseicyclus aestuarii]|uniref:Metal-dependent carboxypeptidase n=1 Tax=Pseudoroseicyclus aestuarii TaxID=1795041 RepID=A0A318SP09_9RHOB|nr:carboxypeptidase M32 [Pseudoroseicyclus aestuarii]PYE82553.1 carboxypeptidase Taq [Pseudoroseicyclus aestuarii]
MSDFDTRVARIHDVLAAVNAIDWDARVMMPAGGAEGRGHQIATLKGLAREMILDPALADAAAAAQEVPETRAAAAQVLEAIDHHARIPAELLRRKTEGSAIAGAAWAEARAKADFGIFLPHLEQMVALSRETAEALGYAGHPYDPMVDLFEPGETAASLGTLFGELREGIRPILDAALGRDKPRTDFLYRHYPLEGQQRFARHIAEWLGYDFDRGRLDTAVHPFEISQGAGDVRITSRWPEGYLPMSIFGTIHEVGHALYEQGADPAMARGVFASDLKGLYAVSGTSFGMHESQSRLLENHVGRTPEFWDAHFSALRDIFPEQLADVTAEEFVAAVNRVEPGPIRVEADELCYDLHIMLRVRLEMALMDGSLAPADLPQAWNEGMRRDLGIDPADDAQGCLQDVHWSHGYIGSFPTYTIGNMTAAQLMAAGGMGTGIAALRDHLRDTVWRHGRSKSRPEMVGAAGGDAGDPAPYLRYLSDKFAAA